MNNVLLDNISLLRRLKPSLYHAYSRYPLQGYIRVVNSRSGLPVPVVKNIHVHSIYDPEKEAELLLGRLKAEFQNNKEFLVAGWGFAYHVHKLIQGMKPERLIIAEADPGIFFKSLEYVPLGPILDTDPDIILGRRAGITDLIFNSCRAIKGNMPDIIRNPGSYNLFSWYYDAIIGKIQKICLIFGKDIISSSLEGKKPFDSPGIKKAIKRAGQRPVNIYCLGEILRKDGELTRDELSIMLLKAIIKEHM